MSRVSRPSLAFRQEVRPSWLWVLLIGALHGLLYVFLIPPWQHYDEPGHFEYAWLLANRAPVAAGDYDQGLRREVAASMVEHDFFEGMGWQPNLLLPSEPVWIGVSQVGEPSFYYQLAALPLRLLQGSDVTLQLYAARLISFGLFMFSLVTATGIAATLSGPAHPLRWMLPFSLAALPGLVDIMTAVNSDAGAIATFSFFLWGSLRLLQRGFNWPDALWVLSSALVCLVTKNTVYLAVPLAGLVVLISLLPANWQRWSIPGVLITGLLTVPLLTRAQGLAGWYEFNLEQPARRVALTGAPDGSHVFQFELAAGNPADLRQALPTSQARRLGGQTVTLGLWAWADTSLEVQTPVLQIDAAPQVRTLSIGTEPRFYAWQFKLPQQPAKIVIQLAPRILGNAPGQVIPLYIDNLVLAAGDFPTGEIPKFSEPGSQAGRWDGRPFENLVRNHSAEQGWLQFKPALAGIFDRLIPIRPGWILASFSDPPNALSYYHQAGANLLRTLWAKFGWGHVPLLGTSPYRLLAGLTAVGLAGLLWLAWQKPGQLAKPIPAFLGLALLSVWGATVLRGVGETILVRYSAPPARYAYPVIIPTLLLLNLGWLQLGRWLASQPALRRLRNERLATGLYLLAWLGLDVWAVLSVVRFYWGA
ncbi:MAG: hypothetical protein JW862_17805 [Anaerolineales bacterium]|nr:hypothetical protein [Anaerolineales bacterium]